MLIDGVVMMMDPGVRIAAAGAVILSGILLALMFRQESSVATAPTAESTSRLVLRKHVAQPAGRAEEEENPFGEQAGLAPATPWAAGRRPTTVRPSQRSDPAPPLARHYPGGAELSAQHWGTSIGIGLPGATPPEDTLRRHKIVDGDMLEALAERYLGSADRSLEIYEANREVLSSPRLLPIGADLKIPPRQRPPAPPATEMVERRLVPVIGEED